MSKDAELDRVKAVQDNTFRRKQDTYQAQQRAWEKRASARDEVNRAHEAKQRAYAEQDRSWQRFQSLRASNGARIDHLNAQQERAFQSMKLVFDSASAAHDRRDGAAAASYTADGHRFKAEAQGYVAERRRLVDEIRSARALHEPYKAAFQRAKDQFSSCKRSFDSVKAQHERASSAFKHAKAEFDACTKAFKSRLEKVKAEGKQRRLDKQLIAAKAGVPHQYRDNVRISTDASGNTNIYFGGIGKPDGPARGHYVLDRNGKVTYARDPNQDHGAHNFTDTEGSRGGTLYYRSARSSKAPKLVANRNNSKDSNDRDGTFYDRNGDIDLHVTQVYDDNYRVSWDTDGASDRDYHWTNQSESKGNSERKSPPPDAAK